MSLFNRHKKTQFVCWHCGAPLVKRTSLLAHIFMRQDLYVCDFPPCGATYNGTTEITHQASPSGMPEAKECPLPQTPHYIREMARKVYQDNLAIRQMSLLEEAQEEQKEPAV